MCVEVVGHELALRCPRLLSPRAIPWHGAGHGLAVLLDWVPNHMSSVNVLTNYDGPRVSPHVPEFASTVVAAAGASATVTGPQLRGSEREGGGGGGGVVGLLS